MKIDISGRRGVIALPVVLFVLLLIFGLSVVFVVSQRKSLTSTLARGPIPANDKAKGLVFDGLEVPSDEATCPGGYIVRGKSGKSFCTPGPDAAPDGFSVEKTVTPVGQSDKPKSVLGTSVTCDGDGQSGQRVQLIYAHTSGGPDNYNAYLPSFQTWAAGMDAIYNESALKTGSTRHIRFVHDASCVPVIPNVTLSPLGLNGIEGTISELQAMGYGGLNRKVIIFADAHVYCGIGTIRPDDQPGPQNANNIGNSWGRIDAGCWSDVVPAHELGHELGAVQMSAPHSSGDYHCWDGYDDMCRPPSGLKVLCPKIPWDGAHLDCNNDDFFSTETKSKTYLGRHWNVANSQYLIAPLKDMTVSLVTKNGRSLSNSFKLGDRISVSVNVVDQTKMPLTGAMVGLSVNPPLGSAKCSLTLITDSSGNAQGICATARGDYAGTWNVHVDGVSAINYTFDSVSSDLDHGFSVQ